VKKAINVNKKILHIVDSVDYATTNCFQHQLTKTLSLVDKVKTVTLDQVLTHKISVNDYEQILSCLKQRTLFNNLKSLSVALKNKSVVIYDQDPWSGFTDDSPYKDSYRLFFDNLNVKTFAVTTSWWTEFIKEQKLPATFVKMWVLPEYCSKEPAFVSRKIELGFIGGLHSYRRMLIQELEKLDVYTHVTKGGLNYNDFLRKLSDIQCFIHAENSSVFINNERFQFYANWVKNVEAASRGCFSVRKFDPEAATYLGDIKTVLTYENVKEIPDLLENLQKMDPGERQLTIDTSVEYIREANVWQETAAALIL